MFGKRVDQDKRDRNRKAYRLVFPADLSGDQVGAWLQSISGTLRHKHTLFMGLPSIVFEMWATVDGIAHILRVPWQHEDYVINQLRMHIPGLRYSPEEEYPAAVWARAVEVGLTQTSQRLRIPAPESLAAALLGSVGGVDKHETILMQWVATPAVPQPPPSYEHTQSQPSIWDMVLGGSTASRDEVTDRRAKLEQANFMAVLRVAAVAKTAERANHLIFRVKAALASARSPSVRFETRLVSSGQLQRRIDQAASPLLFPMRLSLTELGALIAWPIGSPMVSGLPQALARHMPAASNVPASGRIIGRSTFPGGERPIAIAFHDALKHVHVCAPTGAGKTALLANMLKQDIENGFGAVLIENKGDLFEAALDYIPEERLKDVIVMDVNDVKHPVGFNILQQGDPAVVVDELNRLFIQLFKDNPSLWMQEVMYHGLHTLLSNPNSTFIDLAALVSPAAEHLQWRDELIRSAKDPQLRSFWQRFDNQPRARQDQMAQPLMSRVWPLSRSKLRNIIGQSQSSFQMADVVRDNKILLVNLAGIEREAATLMGTLLMNALWHAVKTTRSDKPTFLYLDEFQDFMHLPIDAADMLAKARSMGLGITMAHQHMGQLTDEMREALNANARSKIVFQMASEDARKMARAMGNTVSEQDLMNLGRFEAVARVATGDGVSPPLTMTTLKPSAGRNLAGEVVVGSRRAYGRPLAEVVEAMNQRHQVTPSPRARQPRVGTVQEDWL